MKITILGNVPSQKNRKIISVNRGTGRPFLRSAPAVKEWQEKAQLQIRAQIKEYKVQKYPVSVVCVFFYDSLRRHDLDNALSSVMDALTASGVIEDDSTKYVDSISIQYGGHDKENPRAEVFLDE